MNKFLEKVDKLSLEDKSKIHKIAIESNGTFLGAALSYIKGKPYSPYRPKLETKKPKLKSETKKPKAKKYNDFNFTVKELKPGIKTIKISKKK